jgi:hypothetical protein
MGLLEELKKYVVEYYKMGLSWNPKVGSSSFTYSNSQLQALRTGHVRV